MFGSKLKDFQGGRRSLHSIFISLKLTEREKQAPLPSDWNIRSGWQVAWAGLWMCWLHPGLNTLHPSGNYIPLLSWVTALRFYIHDVLKKNKQTQTKNNQTNPRPSVFPASSWHVIAENIRRKILSICFQKPWGTKTWKLGDTWRIS